MRLILYFEFPDDQSITSEDGEAEDSFWGRLKEANLIGDDDFIEGGGECALNVDAVDAEKVKKLVLEAFPKVVFTGDELAE